MEIILETVVGSTLHGSAVNDGLEDLDLMAVGIEPIGHVLTIQRPEALVQRKHFDTIVERTKPEGVRSEAGDVDRTVYGLRKWAALVAGGNPTAIMPLYAPPQHVRTITHIGRFVVGVMRNKAVSRMAFYPFSGYMQAQLQRLLGNAGQKRCTRPELIERYGYDTKYAMHVVRLGMQGVELLHKGEITFSETSASILRSIRQGEFSLEAVTKIATNYLDEMKDAYTSSPLPPSPDYTAVDACIQYVYKTVWDRTLQNSINAAYVKQNGGIE